jgi:hypothetical protein
MNNTTHEKEIKALFEKVVIAAKEKTRYYDLTPFHAREFAVSKVLETCKDKNGDYPEGIEDLIETEFAVSSDEAVYLHLINTGLMLEFIEHVMAYHEIN